MIVKSEMTVLESYNLVYTGTGTGGEPTEFPLGITSGDINMGLAKHGKIGTETKSNRLCMLFLADQAGTATIVVTGACQGGPEEYIASLALTSAAIVETGTDMWVDDITLTSYHIARNAILVADVGNSRPAKFGFDAVGYQFIKFYTKSFVSITSVKVYARYF